MGLIHEQIGNISVESRSKSFIVYVDGEDYSDSAEFENSDLSDLIAALKELGGDDQDALLRARLIQECDKYGLPHGDNLVGTFEMLLRHIYNNHSAALGAAKDRAERLEERAQGN